MPASVPQLNLGGQSPGVEPYIPGQENRIVQRVQEAEATKRVNAQAQTSRMGQQSQERMATQQEQGVTQRNNDAIAAQKAAQEYDRVTQQTLLKEKSQYDMDAYNAHANRAEAIARGDMAEARRYYAQEMAFREKIANWNQANTALEFQMLGAYIDMQQGNLMRKVSEEKVINQKAEEGDVIKKQNGIIGTSAQSFFSDWNPEELPKEIRVNMNRLPESAKKKESSSTFDPFATSKGPGRGIEQFREPIEKKLDQFFVESRLPITSKLLLNQSELENAATSWGSAEWVTVTKAIEAAKEQVEKKATGKYKETSLDLLEKMSSNVDGLMFSNRPMPKSDKTLKQHIAAIDQRNSISSLTWAISVARDNGASDDEITAMIQEKRKYLSPESAVRVNPRPAGENVSPNLLNDLGVQQQLAGLPSYSPPGKQLRFVPGGLRR